MSYIDTYKAAHRFLLGGFFVAGLAPFLLRVGLFEGAAICVFAAVYQVGRALSIAAVADREIVLARAAWRPFIRPASEREQS